jgi:hypothetical protein
VKREGLAVPLWKRWIDGWVAIFLIGPMAWLFLYAVPRGLRLLPEALPSSGTAIGLLVGSALILIGFPLAIDETVRSIGRVSESLWGRPETVDPAATSQPDPQPKPSQDHPQ